MPLNHRAEHSKLTPCHISMVIEANGLLPGRQCAGGSVSLCPHQRGWHGETTDADCASSMANSIDRIPYTYETRARHGCKDLYEAQLRRSIRLQICCIKSSEGNPTVGDVTSERPLQQYSSLLALYG